MFALLGLLFIGGPSAVFAQGEDSTDVSLDAPKESSNTLTYALVGGIIILGGAAFYFMKKKKN